MYPDSIKKLMDCFRYLPGVGEKTAERYAFYVLELSSQKVDLFSQSLQDVKQKIRHCSCCNSLTELETCSICNDTTRENDVLCVVEDVKSVFLFEKLGTYHGFYHVLNDLIRPLDGVNPEDIGLDRLIDRIKKQQFKEVILAFKPSIEGETTALYIKRILEGLNIVVTRLASGIPMGADMEYVDSLTLERAFDDRKKIA